MKRAARSIRSGSSLKLTSGRQRRAQHAWSPGRRRRRTGSISSGAASRRQLERHGVDGEVAPARGRPRSSSANVDVRLARVVGVRLGPVGRDLVRSAPSPRRWRRSCRTARPGSTPRRPSPSRQRLDLGGPGVGGQVEVDSPPRRCRRSRSRTMPPTRYSRWPAAANRSASGASSASTGAKRSGIMAPRRLRGDRPSSGAMADQRVERATRRPRGVDDGLGARAARGWAPRARCVDAGERRQHAPPCEPTGRRGRSRPRGTPGGGPAGTSCQRPRGEQRRSRRRSGRAR